MQPNNNKKIRRPVYEPMKRKKKKAGVVLPGIAIVLCMIIGSYLVISRNKAKDEASDNKMNNQQNIENASNQTGNNDNQLGDNKENNHLISTNTNDKTDTDGKDNNLNESNTGLLKEEGMNNQSSVSEKEEEIKQPNEEKVASYSSLKEYCDSLFAGKVVLIEGDVCDTGEGYLSIVPKDIDDCFYSEEISDEVFLRMEGKSFKEDCTILREDLRYIRVLHYGFDDLVHVGELVVNKDISQDTVDIFKELFDAKYKIERILLIDEYNADDEISMMANNSSSFNYRVIANTNVLSKHGAGMAIDINTLYNPYVRERDGETYVSPENATDYVDRTQDNPYFIREGDVCYNAFVSRGFEWGGNWNSVKDYQHFER